MKSGVLIIPLDEIRQQFEKNSRQDVKIVAADLLSDELFEALVRRGIPAKRERPLEGDTWKHSEPDEPNYARASGESFDPALFRNAKGLFSVAFATEGARQDEHLHDEHFELYYSERRLAAEYRNLETGERGAIDLDQGGVIIFAPGVAHKVILEGLTLVLEFPSVPGDKRSLD